MVGEGVSLDPDIEEALEQIASILTDRRAALELTPEQIDAIRKKKVA